MKLRELTGYIYPQLREPSTCEACGDAFTCGATLKGCWCSEVKLSDTARAELRARYRRCLCRTCLERFAAGPTEDTSSGAEGKLGTSH